MVGYASVVESDVWRGCSDGLLQDYILCSNNITLPHSEPCMPICRADTESAVLTAIQVAEMVI